MFREPRIAIFGVQQKLTGNYTVNESRMLFISFHTYTKLKCLLMEKRPIQFLATDFV